ncbi:MAG: hypothetical protein Kow0074_22790 [Candidatus Zixiibacteriota bacterium]
MRRKMRRRLWGNSTLRDQSLYRAVADGHRTIGRIASHIVQTVLLKGEPYGETWPRGLLLMILIIHDVHRRGLMTVLMHQARIMVPGVFGPAEEELAAFGAQVAEL